MLSSKTDKGGSNIVGRKGKGGGKEICVFKSVLIPNECPDEFLKVFSANFRENFRA